MQITKKEIKHNLIKASKELFLEKGYEAVSMRNIAERAKIGLSNIYNYVSSKEELFRLIVQPVIQKLIKITEKNCDSEKIKTNINNSIDVEKSENSYNFIEEIIKEYTHIIYKFRTEISILLFRAKGCTFETFKQDFSDRVTVVFKGYLNTLQKMKNIKTKPVSDEFIHLHTIWILSLFEEVILNDIRNEKLDNLINEYIKYETMTWKEIIPC